MVDNDFWIVCLGIQKSDDNKGFGISALLRSSQNNIVAFSSYLEVGSKEVARLHLARMTLHRLRGLKATMIVCRNDKNNRKRILTGKMQVHWKLRPAMDDIHKMKNMGLHFHLFEHWHPLEKNNAWMSIPQFGGWDQKSPGATDYSIAFSRARANRKQQKTDFWRSLGNEHEFIANEHEFIADSLPLRQEVNEDSVTKRKKILTYINCCIRP